MQYYNDEEFDYGPALEYIEAVNGETDLDYAMESLGGFEPIDEFDAILESLAIEGMEAYQDNDYDRLYAVLEELDEAQDVADEDEKKLRRKQRLKKAAKIGAALVTTAVAIGAGNKLRKHLKGKKANATANANQSTNTQSKTTAQPNPVKTADLVPENPQVKSRVDVPSPTEVKLPRNDTERSLEIAAANGGNAPKAGKEQHAMNRQGRRKLNNDAEHESSGPKKQQPNGKRKQSNRSKGADIEAAKRNKTGELSNFEKKQQQATIQTEEAPTRRPGSSIINTAGLNMLGRPQQQEQPAPIENREQKRAREQQERKAEKKNKNK